jgi:hypothetical protein
VVVHSCNLSSTPSTEKLRQEIKRPCLKQNRTKTTEVAQC